MCLEFPGRYRSFVISHDMRAEFGIRKGWHKMVNQRAADAWCGCWSSEWIHAAPLVPIVAGARAPMPRLCIGPSIRVLLSPNLSLHLLHQPWSSQRKTIPSPTLVFVSPRPTPLYCVDRDYGQPYAAHCRSLTSQVAHACYPRPTTSLLTPPSS